jgi:acyl carrier protein
MSHIEDQLSSIIAAHLRVGETCVIPAARIKEDLEASPLAFADLIVSLEERFAIRISGDEAASIETVDDLLALVKSKLHAKARPGVPHPVRQGRISI